MSVKVNSTASDVTFSSVAVPTPIGTSNTNIVATTAFVRTYISSLAIILNEAVSITISATKTIPIVNFVTTLASGILGSINIGTNGTGGATAINILSSASTTAGQLCIYGQAQLLKATGVAGFNTPLLSNSGARKAFQAGKATAVTNGGTTVLFPVAFPVGSNVNLYCCCNSATASLIMTYQPAGVTQAQGFGVAVQGGGKDVNWLAFSAF